MALLQSRLQKLLCCSDLTEIMATSRDYNQLREVWKKWRDVSGTPTKEDFKKYVELENKAAVLNGK